MLTTRSDYATGAARSDNPKVVWWAPVSATKKKHLKRGASFMLRGVEARCPKDRRSRSSERKLSQESKLHSKYPI